MNRDELMKTIEQIKKKALAIGKVVKEDAVIGAQMGKHKVQELDLERKKLAKLLDLGRKSVALYKKDKLSQDELRSSCESVIKLEKEISKQRTAFSNQKKKLKKIPVK